MDEDSPKAEWDRAIAELDSISEFEERMGRVLNIIVLARLKLQKRVESGEMTFEQTLPYRENLRQDQMKVARALIERSDRLVKMSAEAKRQATLAEEAATKWREAKKKSRK